MKRLFTIVYLLISGLTTQGQTANEVDSLVFEIDSAILNSKDQSKNIEDSIILSIDSASDSNLIKGVKDNLQPPSVSDFVSFV